METENLNELNLSGSGSKSAISRTQLLRTSSLDSLKHNSNTQMNSDLEPDLEETPAPCGAARYVLSGERDEDGLHRHYKTFCKSYGCEFCGRRKIFMMKKGFELAIKKHGLDVFVTLTLDQKRCACKPEESSKYIRKAWNKFRTLQKREFDRNLQFVAVTEFQKNGYAHLHILFDGYLPYEWIKRAWVAVGGGEILWVRQADSGTARYLAKYLGKSMLSQTGRKRRAFSTSQGISIARLLKDERGESVTQFRFCRTSEEEARDILGAYITGNILDSRKRVLGFKATKQLNPKPASE